MKGYVKNMVTLIIRYNDRTKGKMMIDGVHRVLNYYTKSGIFIALSIKCPLNCYEVVNFIHSNFHVFYSFLYISKGTLFFLHTMWY